MFASCPHRCHDVKRLLFVSVSTKRRLCTLCQQGWTRRLSLQITYRYLRYCAAIIASHLLFIPATRCLRCIRGVLGWSMCTPACFYVAQIDAVVELRWLPFCSSCLQSGWHGAWSDAGLHNTKLMPALAPLRPGCDVSTLPVVALKYHEVGFVFAVLQLCQCATDSRCDWLKLMEGAGLSLIAHADTHKSWSDCYDVVWV